MKFNNTRSAFIKFKWVLYIMVCMLLLWGCSEKPTVGEDVSSDTGSISFNVVWQGAANNTPSSGTESRALSGNPCQDFGITWIVAKVYNESDELDRQSPNWDCTERGGTISGVSPGLMHVVIEGFVGDIDIMPEWMGESDPVEVTAGGTSNAGSVDVTHTSDVTPPTIVATVPEQGFVGIPINIAVTVEFSEPVVEASIDNASFSLVTTGDGNPVTGTVSYNGNTAVFDPTDNLVSGTSYTVTIAGGSPSGVVDLAGNFLAADYSFEFAPLGVPDTTPPTVTNHTPVGDSVGVGDSIQVAFSEPMNPGSISVTTFLVDNGTTNIAGSILYQADNGVWTNVATFDPLTDLQLGTVYSVTIVSGDSGAKDLAENPLQTDYTWSFTTSASQSSGLIWDQGNWNEKNWN
jgi:Big-like domain-containing protein